MTCTAQAITIASPSTRSKELALSARKLLEDLKELEARMMASNDWQQYPRRISSLAPSSPQRRSLPPRTSTSATSSSYFSCQSFLDHSTSATFRDCANKKHVSGAFVTFCEHLLYINHVWKQERQLRSLRASIQALEKAKCSNAFKAFCDRLLLSNRIWQLERQIQEITAEGEKNKRARVAAISRAAQQMAVDVRKEAMIEELVTELMEELRENKEAMYGMKEEHEREIREIQGDWLKEYRQLARENERMRLERHARLMEQEISNEVEQSLSNALEHSQQRVQELECGDGDSTLVGDTFDRESVLFSGSSSSVGTTETEDLENLEVDDGMSTISSATCVSVEKLPNWPTKSAVSSRRQRHNTSASSESHDAAKNGPSRRQSIPLRKLDATPYAGFSFNPLFFGNPETLVVSPSRPESTEVPWKVAFKFGSSSMPSSSIRTDPMMRNSRLVGPIGQRGPWKI